MPANVRAMLEPPTVTPEPGLPVITPSGTESVTVRDALSTSCTNGELKRTFPATSSVSIEAETGPRTYTSNFNWRFKPTEF